MLLGLLTLLLKAGCYSRRGRENASTMSQHLPKPPASPSRDAQQHRNVQRFRRRSTVTLPDGHGRPPSKSEPSSIRTTSARHVQTSSSNFKRSQQKTDVRATVQKKISNWEGSEIHRKQEPGKQPRRNNQPQQEQNVQVTTSRKQASRPNSRESQQIPSQLQQQLLHFKLRALDYEKTIIPKDDERRRLAIPYENERTSLQVYYDQVEIDQERTVAKLQQSNAEYQQQLHYCHKRASEDAIIIRRKDDELNRLTTQLSRYMNQRLGEDESSLENINSKHRPSKIVEDYSELVTTQWLDAKDQLDEAFPEEAREEEKLRHLCDVLLLAGRVTQSLLKKQKALIQTSLCKPLFFFHKQAASSIEPSLDEFDPAILGTELDSALNAFMKTRGDEVEAIVLVRELLKGLDPASLLCKSKRSRGDQIEQYILASCQIAWRMAIQRPPITFDTSDIGKPADKNVHDVYYSCTRRHSNVITSYVWPMLKQKGKCLWKGKVFVAPSQARTEPSTRHVTIHRLPYDHSSVHDGWHM